MKRARPADGLGVTAIGLGRASPGSFLRQQKRDSCAISTKVGRLLHSAIAAPEDDHCKGRGGVAIASAHSFGLSPSLLSGGRRPVFL